MNTNTSDTNKRLLETFREWEKQSNFLAVAKKHMLSRPFVCSVSDRYIDAKKRIMIVGQETKDFPLYDYDWSEEEIQSWGIAYLEKQLWNEGDQGFNRSAFWKIFRYVEQNFGYCPCWNNIDKAHRITEGKTEPLSSDIEIELNRAILSNGNTILQEEISITNPKVVLFITGPYYWKSMAAALRLNESELFTCRPTVHHLCSDISELVGLEKRVLWTYHPTYLNWNERNKGLFTVTMDIIKKHLMD